jgi:hypothetical protein
MLAGLQDISEEACTLFRRDTIIGIGAAVEPPAGSIATLSLKD